MGFAVKIRKPPPFGYLCSSLCCCGFAGQTSRPVWAASVFSFKNSQVARWVLTADWGNLGVGVMQLIAPLVVIFCRYLAFLGVRACRNLMAPCSPSLTPTALLDLECRYWLSRRLPRTVWYERYRQFKSVCLTSQCRC
ncbi:hypothetical protein KCP73_25720 [Salmonella enterica subsp. enterica]|nr:hypothetical protein KCP73_25720 [Salmonella enterica subsp. enterica]